MRGFVRVVALATAVALLLPMSASAESPAQLQARLAGLKKEASAAGREFSQAYWRLDETEVKIIKQRRRVAASEKRLAAAKQRLNMRANGMYRSQDLGFAAFLLGSRSFEQFATRVEYMNRIGSADARTVAEVKRLRRRLIAEQRSLERQRKTRASDLRTLRVKRDRLQSRLKSLNARFLSVKAQLDASRGGRASGVAASPGPNGMVFPVVGSYYYSNTWGASRSGGRRTHKGTDIMAPNGTPCVAVLSGTVTAKDGGLGGRTIWLSSDSGWQFYYAHLSDWAVRSGRVRAGQVIGYVGSTGNAAASAPHLHFQMHPGGGAPVNPYPYLRSME